MTWLKSGTPFKERAMNLGYRGIMMVHTHPAENPPPSTQDVERTFTHVTSTRYKPNDENHDYYYLPFTHFCQCGCDDKLRVWIFEYMTFSGTVSVCEQVLWQAECLMPKTTGHHWSSRCHGWNPHLSWISWFIRISGYQAMMVPVGFFWKLKQNNRFWIFKECWKRAHSWFPIKFGKPTDFRFFWILEKWRKMKNTCGVSWHFLDNIWYHCPRNMNIHVQKMTFASTRNSESPFLDPKGQFLIFIFSERPAESSKVQNSIKSWKSEKSDGTKNRLRNLRRI